MQLINDLGVQPWLGKANWQVVADAMGISVTAATNRYWRLKNWLRDNGYTVRQLNKAINGLEDAPEPVWSKETEWTMPNGDTGHAESNTYVSSAAANVTPDELITEQGFDPDLYEVKTAKLSRYGGQRSISVTIGRKPPTLPELTDVLVDGINSVVLPDTYGRDNAIVRYGTDLCVANWLDAHFGKIYLTVANQDRMPFDSRLKQVMRHLIQRTRLMLPKVLVIRVGDDFFNIDNAKAQTTYGTPQENIAWRDMLKFGIGALTKYTDLGVSLCEEVHIYPIEGNHDAYTMHLAGYLLQERYRKLRRVTVHNPAPYNWHDTDNVSIMMVHDGKDAELVEFFAQENPTGFTKRRKEIHKGHKHVYRVDKHGGVWVRSFGSTSTVDSWHYEKRYTDATDIMSLLFYSEETGFVGELHG